MQHFQVKGVTSLEKNSLEALQAAVTFVVCYFVEM